MITSIDLIEQVKVIPLSLDIDSSISLPNLTLNLMNLCDQAEDQDNTVIIIRLISNLYETNGWPGKVCIQDISRWERAIRRLQRVNRVSICILSGLLGGPALDLLLATDYRITSQDFSLNLPVNDGLVWPGMALYQLVNQVGFTRTRQFMLGVHQIDAEWALSVGLIDETTDLLEEAERNAVLRLGKISNSEHAIRRQLLMEASTTTYEDSLGAYLAACDRELRRQSEDYCESNR